jgi:4-aminobutyrate aminotransferase / (S)-3-amino-2-methylpropionate transaminase / 5-aminovalerate transaminase
VVDRAEGATLFDPQGRAYTDLATGIGVMSLGHCDPAVVAAVQAQAARLQHTCIHVATYEPYLGLCERLVQLLPHGPSTKALLLNSGAEAVENAIKIARQATGRPAVVCFTGAFHGRTLLGMSLTSKAGYKVNSGPFAPEIYRLPYPNHYRWGEGLDRAEFAARELRRFEEALVETVPAAHVACVILEVLQGEGGIVPCPPEYLRGLREVCDRHGVLLVFDEVQSGFCRTGRWGAYEHAGVTPDLSTWAKAMGGGLPVSAVVGRAEVMDAAAPGTIGGTFGGNPVACAGALATLARMEELDLNARAVELGGVIQGRLRALQERCSMVGDVRGMGGMQALELVLDGDPQAPAGEAALDAVRGCHARGVLILRAGPYGNVIRLLPPLTIPRDQLEVALDVLCEEVLRATASSKAPTS